MVQIDTLNPNMLHKVRNIRCNVREFLSLDPVAFAMALAVLGNDQEGNTNVKAPAFAGITF